MANAKYIICPFYKSQGVYVIKCEGFDSKNTTRVCFDTPDKKTEYVKIHCESFDYDKKCNVCRRLLKKYYI